MGALRLSRGNSPRYQLRCDRIRVAGRDEFDGAGRRAVQTQRNGSPVLPRNDEGARRRRSLRQGRLRCTRGPAAHPLRTIRAMRTSLAWRPTSTVFRHVGGGLIVTWLGPLSANGSKARYGAAYLRALSAQAGYGFKETSIDEDVLAVDCTLEVPATDIRIQVKCTDQPWNKSLRIGYQVSPHWAQAWSQNLHTVYFVVVRLATTHGQSTWVHHGDDEATLHRAAAYWTGIDPNNVPNRVYVDKDNRLSADTFEQWEQSLLAGAGVGN